VRHAALREVVQPGGLLHRHRHASRVHPFPLLASCWFLQEMFLPLYRWYCYYLKSI
jgi:hypothetical protein